MNEIYFAGGCFWGTQHYLKQIRGVVATAVGYANGTTPNPTYEEVYSDLTGYVECVRVEYDPAAITLRRLVELYFASIDPTLLNRQGNDVGTRYRTGIYYTHEEDRATIAEVYLAEQTKYESELATEVEPLRCFVAAEAYHQDYLEKNPAGYCHLPAALFKFAREANK